MIKQQEKFLRIADNYLKNTSKEQIDFELMECDNRSVSFTEYMDALQKYTILGFMSDGNDL